MINRRRTATSVALPVQAHARELAELMREAEETEAAVMEYWDVHVTSRGAEFSGELAVQLMEELRSALRLAKMRMGKVFKAQAGMCVLSCACASCCASTQ